MGSKELVVSEVERILSGHPSLLWHHCPDSRGCHGTRGMPDFLIVGPRGMIWRECKPNGQHPREGQIEWKYGLSATGLDWSVWTPRDLDSGRVRAEIEALL